MILPEVPESVLVDLGRTGAGPETLALLVRDQDVRRLLVLRAVLEAAEAASPRLCSAGQKARLRQDWALLAEADRSAQRGGPSGSTPARARLLYPLTGAWGWRCLRDLSEGEDLSASGTEHADRLAHDLAHFSALAAAAAVRAGVPFSVRLNVFEGKLVLPSLGALQTARSGVTDVEVRHENERLILRQAAAPDLVVHPESDFGAWSGSHAWTSAYALPGLLPGTPPVPLDDLDPYRTVRDPRHRALSGPTTLDNAERKQWLQAWSSTSVALRSGGEQRVTEAMTLLRCLVPLASPPGSTGSGHGSCSATRREAFGALLSSVPSDPVTLAATLVHELHHAKLAALSDMVPLHRAPGDERYFAPWRPDPRPYDGLLQGAYSHLAIADYYQRRALAEGTAQRESAWAQHARYRVQVGAVLPALVASPDLTPRGRRFVDEMIAAYEHMAAHPAPRGHTARAQAYVNSARTLWRQRHAFARRPNE
ncbi:HEXXH motif domain-containing protein [Streptomyces asoensis]|uniref:HEXXH motif domain-containing protein n=1 Tax=Streptomyces asoensis TaxID=249586 RepID=A0ABQ3SBE9_9ACTN|nr:HEXXH motif domain-containing protein [Streptomyces asoensis]GHI65439.1 HEXXH motif domain-containing protein [Streptomyces asoensis]